MTYKLCIDYKGSRQYLHASDFYNELTKIMVKKEDDFELYITKLIIKKFIRNQCFISFNPPANNEFVATCTFNSIKNGKKINSWIIETENIVNSRYDYDENVIEQNAIIDLNDNSITTNKSNSYTTIENIISLTKILSYKIKKLDEGSWVFSKIELDKKLINNFINIQINLKKSLANKYMIFRICIDYDYVGNIYFIVGSP